MPYEMAETPNKANWPAPQEEKFIITLIEETGKGNVRNGIIKKDCGQAVTDEFNNRAGKHYSVDQIKGKLKRLKIKYNLFSRLIGRTDMEWDSNTNTIKGIDVSWLDALKVSVIHLINFHAVHSLNSSRKQSHPGCCLFSNIFFL